jgi:hypothetical protein
MEDEGVIRERTTLPGGGYCNSSIVLFAFLVQAGRSGGGVVNGGEVLRSEKPVQTVSQRPVESVEGEVTSDVKALSPRETPNS